MLSTSQKRHATIGFLIVIILLLGLCSPSRINESPSEQQTTNSYDQHTNSDFDVSGKCNPHSDSAAKAREDKQDELFKRLIAFNITDAIIAVFTVVIGVFTICLFVDARDKGRRELRAYLGIGESGIQFLNDGHLQGYIRIANTGQTPALGVTQAITAKIADVNHPPDFVIPDPIWGNRSIAPGADWQFRIEVTEVSDQDMRDISEYTKAMYIWGRATYLDIYGKSQKLDFRYRSLANITVRQPDGSIKLAGWALHPLDGGNDAS
jgi:hypothetical protein